MKIYTYQLGELQTNCYVLVDEVSKNAVAIDIGGDADFLLEEEKKRGFFVKTVLLTHGHFDHIGGVYKFYERGADVYIGKNDSAKIKDGSLNLSSVFGEKCQPFLVKTELIGGEIIPFETESIEVISTPGHTEGGITYKIKNALFCGDTLFEGGFGRTDFPGGDVIELCKSAKKLLSFDGCKLYPGHGNETSVQKELLNNPINSYIKYYL